MNWNISIDNIALTVDRDTCPVCGDSSREILFSEKHGSAGFIDFIRFEPYWSKTFYETHSTTLENTLVYEIAECDNCHMMYLTQVLSDSGMGILYNAWLDQDMLKAHYSRRSLNKSHDALLGLVRNNFSKEAKPRLLDFGAGYGNLVDLAVKNDFNTYAFDLSTDKNQAIGCSGVTIVHDLSQTPDYFDFIWVNQVLEHLASPSQVLAGLKSSLAKGGLMYLAVPDCRNLGDVLLKQGLSLDLFQLLSPHQHINAFTSSSLKLLAKKHGLKPLSFFDYLGLWSPSLEFQEMKFLAKTVIKSFSASTGMLFKVSD